MPFASPRGFRAGGSMTAFRIGNNVIGGGDRCMVIAEVAQSHDGSLGTAHAFIDLAADCGADAVKFQTHIAAAESTPHEPWRIPFSRQDGSRYEYWKRMEFSAAQWSGLKRHADDRGILFLSSPFSVRAVELLRGIGMMAWKIASGEVANDLLLDSVLEDRRPVILSSGLSSWAELDRSVDRVRSAGAEFAVLQCTTEYPSRPETVGLNILAEMRRRYGCPAGLSDHSGAVFAPLAAVALGASCIEVHLAFHRGMFGPDVPASLLPDQLSLLCDGVSAIHRMLSNSVDKDAQAAAAEPLRRVFGRSIVLDAPVPAGTLIEAGMVSFRKPGTGIPPAELARVIGRRVKHGLPADHLLRDEDLHLD